MESDKPNVVQAAAPIAEAKFSVDKGLSKLTRPLNLIIIGMAGSGKSTFLGKFQNYLLEHVDAIPYMVNLDPAVSFLPFSPRDDIRQEINYKEVMTKYGLGPNGAIMTSLNLYASKFHLTLDKIEQNQEHHKLFLIDTPGQIEVFTWSASGQIITSTLASSSPTALVFIIDSARCQNPNTFMSNMLFCCSILYKTRLPILVVFNKADAADANIPMGWMKDFPAFMEQIRKGSDYLSSLSRSLALALDEFYTNLTAVAVSSLTGKGFDELISLLPTLIKEYEDYYEADLKLTQAKNQRDPAQVQKELEKLNKDLEKASPK